MANICPVCQKDDAVQRLATLVAASQSSGTFSGPTGGIAYSDGKWGSVGGYTALNGSTSTNLAKLLAPPSKPSQNAATGSCLTVYGSIVIFAGIGIFMGVLFSGSNQNVSLLQRILLSAFGGGIFVILGLLTIQSGSRKTKLATDQYSKKYEQWEKSILRWERLYFCHRDGIAFDPETKESFEPAQIQEYIYK